MSAVLDKVIAGGLLVALIFTALAFGANEAWSVGLFELLIALLLLLWAVKWVLEKKAQIVIPPTIWPIAGLLVLGLLQGFGWSMDTEATRGATIVIFFILLAFVMAANVFATHERMGLLVNVMVVYGLALAIFGLVQHFTSEGYIYGVRQALYPSFGPFPNRNHFAGYIEMLAPLPFALIAARAVRRQAWLFYSFAGVLMAVSVFVSLSRGGMMSVVAGIAFVAMLSSRVKPRRASRHVHDAIVVPPRWQRAFAAGKRFGGALVIVIAIAAGVFWIGAEGVVNRAADSLDQIKGEADTPEALFSRKEIWKDTWQMVQAHPFAGSGLGAYKAIFPAYARHDGMFVVEYSHNDYLQALSDGGIIGGALVLAFVVLMGRAVWQAMQSEDPLEAGLALGGGAGIFALLVHSAFDFNLQIPSNALLFVFLAALVSRIAAGVKQRKAGVEVVRPVRLEVGRFKTGVEL